MRLITLISDFGTKDYYVSVLKARLLQASSQINFIDITHQVEPFDIIEAAFALRNAWFHFPQGTTHICTVVTGDEGSTQWIGIAHAGHYFLLPNNGVFSLAFPAETNLEVLLLTTFAKTPFAALEKAVKHIIEERPFNEIGMPFTDMVEKISLQPVIGLGYLRGEVIHVDHFGNVITNITQEIFDTVGQGRSCKVYFRKLDPIQKISKVYNEVEVGENVCLFNSSGLLEIAINMGNASELYSLEKDSTVQIDFFDSLKKELASIV